MTIVTSTEVASLPQVAIGARLWATRAGSGLLLGAAITTLELMYYFPLTSAPNEVGFLSFGSSLLVWGGEGILLALTVGLAERWVSPRELRAWQLALAVAVGAVVAVLTWQTFTLIVLRDGLGVRLFRDHLGTPVHWIGGVFYHSWLMLFFGGLAAAVYASGRWRARMLLALRTAELGRATSQQCLAEARLASLQARIDPDYVFNTLTNLERLYEADPAAADRLLNELIAFLRDALADMRATAASATPIIPKPAVYRF